MSEHVGLSLVEAINRKAMLDGRKAMLDGFAEQVRRTRAALLAAFAREAVVRREHEAKAKHRGKQKKQKKRANAHMKPCVLRRRAKRWIIHGSSEVLKHTA